MDLGKLEEDVPGWIDEVKDVARGRKWRDWFQNIYAIEFII